MTTRSQGGPLWPPQILFFHPFKYILLEQILTPLFKGTRSFILHTGHFLEIIKHLQTIPAHSLLVTLDVNSLYTSITHEQGILATKFLLEKSNMSSKSNNLCLDLLKLILYKKKNSVWVTYYVQTRGTTMFSNVAPPYTNAFMNLFENEYIYTNELFS
ncbi:unnamed protein product [Ranitomeya imitator]|uniref:Reverse transcriptase domain-containing protein n=1 Tax=Ranitomeya imitator TaxID=111125 RepID=A0ABN9L0R8_9NEOB|nr:unnamed protein product [Ranitomeya imitator]